MTKTDAIKHFGSQTKLAKAIGRAKNTVNGYPEKLNRGVQFELYYRTQGQLQLDSELK
jgi:hypothetical protein